ncbi:LexA family transcriptional regulator [Salmonella enterica subsp. enterica serovar Choleraesuis]|nr:LexA family transcriptional regulator [Salmonella enterica subsp. enterica serovar Choleraesuis]
MNPEAQMTNKSQQKNELTPRQAEVLQHITSFIDANGYPPTIQELTAMVGCRSQNTVFIHLRSLHRKGAIVHSRGISRGITVAGRQPTAAAVDVIRALMADTPDAMQNAADYLARIGEV